MNGNPYARFQPGQGAQPQQQPQTAQGMGPYSPRVQAKPMQRPAPQAAQQAPKSDGGGMLGGMMGGMMGGLSDERSKKEIQELESANDALTKALSARPEYPDTSAPSPGLQALGQQENLGPMQARFADAPDPANTVAAQNVGLQQQQPQAAAPAPRPTAPQWNPTAGQSPPDLSALDEAYRRIGATQGG